ncbi:MAG: flavin reductase family protein [Firmicutes bacterium]|nr:flavin reductase family protein [Bacillota bacterium]
MKKTIQPFDYAGEFPKSMKRGILLTTKCGDQVNTMTIGWGTIGIEWGRPIFIAYVRDSRYTKELLEKTGEFTVSAPYGEVDPHILGFCGTKSGRDVDKIQALGLHLEPPVAISAPGIRELPLTLECKVIYKQKQEVGPIPQEIQERYYPVQDGAQDFHLAYYGEIVASYLIEP